MALKRREAKADLIGRDLERHNSQDWVNDLDGVARQNIVGFVEFRDLGVRIGTFNYEPYLPYLLKKAYTVRCEATGSQSDPKVIDALTSGFLYRDVESLEEGRGICLLFRWALGGQVHNGSIIMISGNPAAAEEARQAGATEFLDKHTDMKVLEAQRRAFSKPAVRVQFC